MNKCELCDRKEHCKMYEDAMKLYADVMVYGCKDFKPTQIEQEAMTCGNCYYREYTPQFPPCEDCLKDWRTIGKKSSWVGAIWEKKTNADRIRAMSDEELAEFMECNVGCDDCRFFTICRSAPQDRVCSEYWLDWLKEEVEE